jgi:hypothetical protein
MRRLTRRRAQHPPAQPVRVRGALASVAELRYSFDSARDPDAYPARTVAKVMCEGSNVLVLHDRAGDVVIRYRLKQALRRVQDPPRDAYVLLEEL